jgi:hypothetical protein
MASEVDICNLALAGLGDGATVASINPPEASTQAQHCARFYYQARDAVLEMHDWSFATKTVLLTEYATPVYGWDHNYAQPVDLIKPIKVLYNPALGSSDQSAVASTQWYEYFGTVQFQTTPHINYSREIDDIGNYIICTNQAGAVLKYIAQVSDTGKFTPTFVDCLVMYLQAKLAGPVIKGDEGRQAAMAAMGSFRQLLGIAKEQDCRSHSIHVRHVAPWIQGR